MKVNSGMSLSGAADFQENGFFGKVTASGTKGQGKKTINGAGLRENLDPIARKRALAQRRAHKTISDTFVTDKKMDDDQAERARKIDQHYKALGEAYRQIKEIDEKKESLRQEYGVDPDSQEQKDLEILEKYNRKKRGITYEDTWLSMEEMERAQELEKQGYLSGYTEYQQRALEADAGKDVQLVNMREAKKGIMEESGMIRGMKLERLKYHAMVDAQIEADEILKAAGKDIYAMLIDEAKDYIDEKNEEELEKAQENKEEKKEKEEKLEEAKERREELEAYMDPENAEQKARRRANDTDLPVEEMTEGFAMMDKVKGNVKQQVADMMSDLKIAAEEIKGLKVDELL